MKHTPPSRFLSHAFTLIELLTAMALFAVLSGFVLTTVNQTSSIVQKSLSKIDAFQGARSAFDLMTQKLSQATLNTYWDYDIPAKPTKYRRQSDLHFLVRINPHCQELFFQAPESISMNTDVPLHLLNACGYFVQYGSDSIFRPEHVKQERWRYRLFQAQQPTEALTIFTDNSSNWADDLHAFAWPIVDNVIALIISPRLSAVEDVSGTKLSQDYTYDSRAGTAIQLSQLPPALEITIIVIDEASAVRLASGVTPPRLIEEALAGKFAETSLFEQDLKDVKERLTESKINYRVFNGSIALRESKWSSTP